MISPLGTCPLGNLQPEAAGNDGIGLFLEDKVEVSSQLSADLEHVGGSTDLHRVAKGILPGSCWATHSPATSEAGGMWRVIKLDTALARTGWGRVKYHHLS